MKCPFCGHTEDKVLETRVQKGGAAIRRRRECLQCAGRYTTQEMILQTLPLVVKKDGRKETFMKKKLAQGIFAACQKRPIPKTKIEAVVENVMEWVSTQPLREIPAAEIGARILQELRPIDPVAYVRFASVHRTFNDVEDFLKNLDPDVSALAAQGLTPEVSQ